MSFYKITFDSVEFPNRTARNYSLTAEAENADAMQEQAIDLLEGMSASHGNIVEISRVDKPVNFA